MNQMTYPCQRSVGETHSRLFRVAEVCNRFQVQFYQLNNQTVPEKCMVNRSLLRRLSMDP